MTNNKNNWKKSNIRANVNTDAVADLEIMLKRKKVEQLHHYAIMYNEKRDAWYTCHPLDYKKRIQRRSKEALLDALAPYYLEQAQSTMTLEELYPEWLDYKRQITTSPNTIAAHQKHWKKYFQGTPMFRKQIGEITLKELNLWANSLIRTYNLTSKKWQTIRIIPKQMFEYAYISGYISQNIFPDIRITVKFRQTVRKTGETEVYNLEELSKILDDLTASYEKSHHKRFLGVILNFMLGLRAAELTALQWRDVSEDSIHIQREMVSIDAKELAHPAFENRLKSSEIIILPGEEGKKHPYVIVDHTKTYRDRYIPLVPHAKIILDDLKKLSPDAKPGDFIFEEKGKRMNLRSYNSILEYACEHIGIDTKRSHAVRRSMASILAYKNLPLDTIRRLLGHNNLSTTFSYIYSALPSEEEKNLMNEAYEDTLPIQSHQVTSKEPSHPNA